MIYLSYSYVYKCWLLPLGKISIEMSDYRTSKSKVEKAECPYCDQYTGLSQNLRRHITDKHPGKSFKRKVRGKYMLFSASKKSQMKTFLLVHQVGHNKV